MRLRRTGDGSRRTAAAVSIAAVAVTAGCSNAASQAPPPRPGQAVRLAAAAAGAVNSFTARVSVRLAPAGSASGTQPVTLAGTVTEWVHPALLAEARYTTLDVAGQSIPGGMSEVITRHEVYIRLSLLRQSLHARKPWVRLPLSAVSASSELGLNSLLAGLGIASPLAQAQLLAGAENVQTVGTGTVAGVPVTEYSGRYSLAGALKKVPARLRGPLGKAFRQVGAGSGTAAFRVWIDGRHLMRKEITTLTSGKLRATLATTVTSLNQPVTITSPSRGQVYAVSPARLGLAGS